MVKLAKVRFNLMYISILACTYVVESCVYARGPKCVMLEVAAFVRKTKPAAYLRQVSFINVT